MPVKKTMFTSIILSAFHFIPLRMRKIFFKSLFVLFYYMIAKNRLITLHNLIRSFPEKQTDEIIGIAKGVYRHFAIVLVEFFDLPYINRNNINKWVDVKGLENYQSAIAEGKGLLTIVAHLGNWELMTIAVPMFLQPIHIVYRPLDNGILDNLVEYVRTIWDNSLIPKGKSGGKIIVLLQHNQLIGILSDQNVAVQEGVFVDFFGRPACTGVGLAALAMRSGSPVLPIFMVRQKSGKYNLVLKPAVKAVFTGDYEKDLFVNTQRFVKITEEVIREYPEQWFWLHQRWKTQKCQLQNSPIS